VYSARLGDQRVLLAKCNRITRRLDHSNHWTLLELLVRAWWVSSGELLRSRGRTY
jgi:hypothetical protein